MQLNLYNYIATKEGVCYDEITTKPELNEKVL